jgi:hypothetical protein
MSTLIAEPELAPLEEIAEPDHWLIFRYSPVALFALKTSRATSTAGKSLLIPTPYAIKMAFVDASLRHRLTDRPDWLVRELARASVRVGVPQHACVTGTIQTVRHETRDSERKRNPGIPFYRSSIAMREVVHCRGMLRVAFDLATCGEPLQALLLRTAPAINYFGRRGSFFQYRDSERVTDLDSTFSEPGDPASAPAWGHLATLDDFGPGATFAALNSFTSTPIERGVHRQLVDTMIPLAVHNLGPGFVHYCAPGAMI